MAPFIYRHIHSLYNEVEFNCIKVVRNDLIAAIWWHLLYIFNCCVAFLGVEGNKIGCVYNVSFSENLDRDNRVDYSEYVFGIPQSEIGQYSLYGTFVTSGLFTEGNWQVTFPLEEIKNN